MLYAAIEAQGTCSALYSGSAADAVTFKPKRINVKKKPPNLPDKPGQALKGKLLVNDVIISRFLISNFKISPDSYRDSNFKISPDSRPDSYRESERDSNFKFRVFCLP
jgi:hypothetical protein